MDWFLKEASKKYELILFTAAEEEYAKKIIFHIDPNGKFFKFKFFRNDCTLIQNNIFKDLSRLGRNLARTLIVDDSPEVFSLLPANGLQIKRWKGDFEDKNLSILLPFLEKLNQSPDVRFQLVKYFYFKTY